MRVMRIRVGMKRWVVHAGKWISSESSWSWRSLTRGCKVSSNSRVRRSEVIVCLMVMWGCHHKVLGVFRLHSQSLDSRWRWWFSLPIVLMCCCSWTHKWVNEKFVQDFVLLSSSSHNWQEQWFSLACLFLNLLLLQRKTTTTSVWSRIRTKAFFATFFLLKMKKKMQEHLYLQWYDSLTYNTEGDDNNFCKLFIATNLVKFRCRQSCRFLNQVFCKFVRLVHISWFWDSLSNIILYEISGVTDDFDD